MNTIEKYQIQHYHTSRLKEYEGNRSKVQGWINKRVQEIRFEVFANSLDFNNASVLDIGCGQGDLKEYLGQHFHGFDYIGLDQQAEFIAYAKDRFQGHNNCWFHEVDVAQCQLPKVDIVAASGAFAYRRENPDYYLNMIQKLYESANRAFIFNMLDRNFFNSGPMIVAHDREDIYRHCQALCNQVIVKTGYLENDFTIVMHKALISEKLKTYSVELL